MFSVLPFIPSALQGMAGIGLLSPGAYFREAKLADHPESARVKELMTRVLSAEVERGTELGKEMVERFDDLPEGTARTVGEWVNRRVRVVLDPGNRAPVQYRGTDLDLGSRKAMHYIMLSASHSGPITQEAIPFIIAHETSHLLNGDEGNTWIHLAGYSLVTAVAASVFTGPIAALGAALAASGLGLMFESRRREAQADVFASQHTTPQERQAALVWMREVDRRMPLWARVLDFITHPSLASRMKKLEASL